MRKVLWWPTVGPQARAAGVVLAAMLCLAVLDLPRFPLFKDYIGLQASPKEFLGYGLLISIANYGLLYLNARGDYLKARSARLPITGTHLLFFFAFPILFALGRYWAKDAPAPDFAALFSGASDWVKGRKLSDDSILQWTRALRVFFVGQSGVTSVLLFSGLWKPPPQDTLEFEAALGRSRPFIRKLFRTEESVSSDEVGELKAYLKALGDSAAKIVGRQLMPQDRTDINVKSKAATALYKALDDRAGGAIEGLRTARDETIVDAVNTLLGE